MEIEISQKFKTQIVKTILSILLFVVIYVALLGLSLALAAGCLFFAFFLVTSYFSIFTVLIGFGIAVFGLLVLFFLLKFMFKINKRDRSHLLEITRQDEGELFEMIDEIVETVKTSKPKRVYLSADVNAAVFYDSSFWSMFFPIRKNLIIGLGLINSVTKDELKAVLSHEFGHFSQESMKLGSYVYNVNQIIYNLFSDNDFFDKIAAPLMNIGIVRYFVYLAIVIISGMVKILRLIYMLVNKSYMALSREMEFQADQIAAHVTGPQPLETALLRLDLADASLNNTISFYQKKFKENKISPNIYKEQSHVLSFLVKVNELEVENDFPKVTLNDINKFNKSKLVIENQWASHPTLEQRIDKLRSYDQKSDSNGGKASAIFNNYVDYQELLTEKIFAQGNYEGEKRAVPFEVFKLLYQKEFEENKFDDYYNGFYDQYNPQSFILKKESLPALSEIETLLSDQNKQRNIELNNLEADIETIKQIRDKNVDVKTFDYDGVKYRRKDCNPLILDLKDEIAQIKDELRENDRKIYTYFKHMEKDKKDEKKLKNYYKDYFYFKDNHEEMSAIYVEIMNATEFFQYQTSIEKIMDNLSDLERVEGRFIEKLEMLLNDNRFSKYIPEDKMKNFELYLSHNWQYFRNETYQEKNIELLFESINNYLWVLNFIFFKLKKRLLDFQVELTK